MNLLSSLFGNSAPTKPIFPKENPESNVQIKGDRLSYEGKVPYWNGEVNIENIQYAYISINQQQVAHLYLCDLYSHHFPVNSRGFKQVYEFLSKKYGFDDVTFFKYLNKKGPLRKEIWRIKNAQNYKILDRAETDYTIGFEIQSPVKEQISWDVTYETLKKSPNLILNTSIHGQPQGFFKYPVRIGNLILKNLVVSFYNQRMDVPVLHFSTDCYDDNSSDRSYQALKKRLKKDLGDSKSYDERPDQCYYSFNIKGMRIALVYTYTSES